MTMMPDPAQFRAAMARLGAAVNILVTDGPAGRHGMTASAVCSVSDSPASLLVCINRSARMHDVLVENGQLSVNVLCDGQQSLSGAFANKAMAMDDRFAAAQWTLLEGEVPALDGALASFGCRIASVVEMGSHSVFLCEVRDIILGGEAAGLVYFDRHYHTLPLREPA